MKKNIFKYFSNIEEYENIIVPSKQTMPEWYKNLPGHINNSIVDMTAKKCLPFMESFIIGYQVLLPCDLYIKQEDRKTMVSWRMEDFSILSERSPEAAKGISIPIGCSDSHFVWQFPAVFEIPKKYSVLFTHPLNRNDLPFVTMSGIIDGNYVFSQNGNVPVFFSNSFEAVSYTHLTLPTKA